MSIVAHVFDYDEKLNYLVGSINICISELTHDNYNNTSNLSEKSENLHDNVFLVHMLGIKFSNNFNKV